MPTPIHVTTRDGVTVIAMDDGKVNALSRAFMAELGAAIDQAVAQDLPIVIAGNGKSFSAGLDLKEVPELDRDGLTDLLHKFEGCLAPLVEAPQPVVAAINGFAIAGGAIIALHCDYRVAHPGAPIGATEFLVGIPFPPTDQGLFTARLPTSTIRQTILRPRRVAGDEAFRMGWIDEVAEDPVAAAVKVANELGGTNPAAYASLKATLNAPILEGMRAFNDDMGPYLDLLQSEATQEAILRGIMAVMSKS